MIKIIEQEPVYYLHAQEYFSNLLKHAIEKTKRCSIALLNSIFYSRFSESVALEKCFLYALDMDEIVRNAVAELSISP